MAGKKENKADMDDLKNELKIVSEANERLNERVLELYTLYNVSRTLSVSRELDELFSLSVNVITRGLNVDQFGLLILDENSGMLTMRASHGMDDIKLKNLTISSGQGIAGKVFDGAKTILVNDISKEKDFFYYDGSSVLSGSYLGVPLIDKQKKVMGVLNAHKPGTGAFSKREVKLFEAVAENVAIAVENAKDYQKTKELSHRDDLTGLHNRRYFFERFEREVERAKRYDRIVSLIMIDIDHFKGYNDTYGHIAGDGALKQVSDVLAENVRKVDIVARYGGEEFVVVLPETDKESAVYVAEKLRQCVEELEFVSNQEKPGKLTVTIGISSYPLDASDSLELLERSDKALYYGKAQGRNMVCTRIPDQRP